MSISPALLVRLSPSLMNVYASCPVFIAIFFFDLGCMLVNWGQVTNFTIEGATVRWGRRCYAGRAKR